MSGHAADQPAAADGNQHGVDLRRLFAELERHRPLSRERLVLVEGVDRQPAMLGNPALAGSQRVICGRMTASAASTAVRWELAIIAVSIT